MSGAVAAPRFTGRSDDMTNRRSLCMLVLAAAGLTGCLKHFVPAPFGTALDEVCNPMNGTLTSALDTFDVGPAIVPVTKGWLSRYESVQDLNLSRIDAELNIWYGTRFLFPVVEPGNAVRCTIARGDTAITIQATRLTGFNYRVEASWQPLINGQYFYMQLQTRYAEHLKQMRGMIEGVRFPTDTVSAKK
jgi:hypothetical protein